MKNKKSLFNLIERATSATIDPRVEEYARIQGLELAEKTEEGKISRADALAHLDEAENYVYALMSGTDLAGEKCDVPNLNATEAQHSADASIIFPRVFNQVLIEPREPNLWLSNNVLETVQFADDTPLFVTFPSIGALSASEIGEGKEYPRQQFDWTEHSASIRIRKFGVATDLNEEIMRHSQWPLLRMYIKALQNAMDRLVEEHCYAAFMNEARVAFDNNDSDTAYHTSGVGSDNAWNGSLTLLNVMTMAGVIIQRRYNPSHFLAHPLSWPIFAQDPFIRATFFTQGQLGQTVWTQLPQYDQSMNFPFGIQYVPYYALPFDQTATLTGAGSGLAPCLISDCYLIDSRNALFMATRGNTEMDQMEDWYKDATAVKARRYWGLAVKDGGMGLTVAKNVRIVQNFEPLMTIRSIQISA